MNRPSTIKDTLDQYRLKLNNYTDDLEQLKSIIEKCHSVVSRNKELEEEIFDKTEQLDKIRKNLSDLQIYIHQERQNVAYLQAENDRLKISDLKSRTKIQILLKLANVTEYELEFCVKHVGDDILVKELPKPFKKTTKSDRKEEGITEYDAQWLRLQNEALSAQLEEQVRLWRDEVHTYARDRELAEAEHLAERERDRARIQVLSSRLHDMETLLITANENALAAQRKYLSSEKLWTEEKQLLRSCDSQKMFQPLSKPVQTEKQLTQKKVSVENKKELDKYKSMLQHKEKLASLYRGQCISLEDRVAQACDDVIKVKVDYDERVQKLLSKIEVLKKRCTASERQRKLEQEGFRNDIKLLRGRLSDIETNFLKLWALVDLDRDVHHDEDKFAEKYNRLKHEVKHVRANVSTIANELRHL